MTMPEGTGEGRLEGWKAIGTYLKRDAATVRRWHQERALPVYRESASSRARVFALPSELDAWQAAQQVDPARRATQWSRYGKAAALVLVLLALGAVALGLRGVRKDERSSKTPTRLFESSTREGGRLAELDLPFEPHSILLSPDGAAIVAYEGRHGRLLERDLRTGSMKGHTVGLPVSTLLFSPDGKQLVLGNTDGLELVDRKTGNRRSFPAGGEVLSIAVTKDGSFAYAAMGPLGVKKIDLKTGEVSVVTLQRLAMFLELDEDNARLFVSYQGSGPGGRPGHDVVEAIALESGIAITSQGGAPLVGGPLSYSRASDRIWVQAWDACATPAYDHTGCPSVPSFGYQVYRGRNLQLIKSLFWKEYQDRKAVLPWDGRLAIVPGERTMILDTASLRIREELGVRTLGATADANGDRVVLWGGRKAWVVNPAVVETDAMAATDQAFPFDGSLEDWRQEANFVPDGKFGFVPGLRGQALRIADSGQVRMRSPTVWGLGNDGAEEVTLSLWFKARGPSTIMRRASVWPWRLEWRGGELLLENGGESIATRAEEGAWHHAALLRRRTRFVLYLDGNRVGEVPARRVRDTSRADGLYVSAGDHDLDEFYTFSRALLPGDLRKLATR